MNGVLSQYVGCYLSQKTLMIVLVSSYATRKCADPRDKVFALLPLTKTEEKERFCNDYSTDRAELFFRLLFETGPMPPGPSIWRVMSALDLCAQDLSTYLSRGDVRISTMRLALIDPSRRRFCCNKVPERPPPSEGKIFCVYCACRTFRGTYFLLERDDDTRSQKSVWTVVGKLNGQGNLEADTSPRPVRWSDHISISSAFESPSNIRLRHANYVQICITRHGFTKLLEHGLASPDDFSSSDELF